MGENTLWQHFTFYSGGNNYPDTAINTYIDDNKVGLEPQEARKDVRNIFWNVFRDIFKYVLQ